jgi:mono/diheme cytochrome c family protein
MKRSILTGILSLRLSLSLFAVLSAGCTSVPEDQEQMPPPSVSGQGTMMGSEMRYPPLGGRHSQGPMMSMVRHQYVMREGIPDRYLAKHNPLPANQETIEAGEQLYQRYCVSCHGPRGYGDGAAGKTLTPPPANIAITANRGMMASDPFLYWTVAEGGTQLNTAMPAFKDTLQEQQIWQLIAYLHQLH